MQYLWQHGNRCYYKNIVYMFYIPCSYFMAPCACIRKGWHIMNTCITVYFDKNKL